MASQKEIDRKRRGEALRRTLASQDWRDYLGDHDFEPMVLPVSDRSVNAAALDGPVMRNQQFIRTSKRNA